VRDVRPPHDLALALDEKLAGRQVLFRPMPSAAAQLKRGMP
jgi:hypothetical protein